mgnify:CR=1 FL=1
MTVLLVFFALVQAHSLSAFGQTLPQDNLYDMWSLRIAGKVVKMRFSSLNKNVNFAPSGYSV